MNNLDLLKIGQFISDLRKKKDLTQAELGDLVGASPKTVSKWENGNSFPDVIYHQKLCETLGIKINELYSGEYDKENRKRHKLRKLTNYSIAILLSILVPLIIFLGTYFLRTYNKTSIYQIASYSENYNYEINGLYVDSPEGNTLYIGKIEIVDIKVTNNDIISIDFYSDDNLVYHHNSLEFSAISFSEKVKINFNNFKVKLKIITANNKEYEIDFKLEFRKINKGTVQDTYGDLSDGITNLNKIESKLKKDGYKKIDELSWKKTIENKKSKIVINYFIKEKTISYIEDQNTINKNIIYHGKLNSIETYIYHNDKNVHTLVEKYTYNYKTENLDCNIGSCSTLDEIKELMNPYISLLSGE